MISIITRTFNRAHVLPRAINSILRQDYADWELVIVDDGSTDNTAEVLAQYQDSRIRVFRHSTNRGIMAAGNTGLEQIHGEWFTFLDSADEVVPNALSLFHSVVEMDPRINAITCNCLDALTGKFTGQGLDRDQYVDREMMFQAFSGEHRGLTKTSLVGGLRFNEQIPSENILWYRLRDAKRYYLHKGLRIYHREGQDRVSHRLYDDALSNRISAFRAMQKEIDYLDILKRYRPEDFVQVMFNIALVSILDGRRGDAIRAYQEIQGQLSWARDWFLQSGLIFGSTWMRFVYHVASVAREKLSHGFLHGLV